MNLKKLNESLKNQLNTDFRIDVCKLGERAESIDVLYFDVSPLTDSVEDVDWANKYKIIRRRYPELRYRGYTHKRVQLVETKLSSFFTEHLTKDTPVSYYWLFGLIHRQSK